MPNFWRRLADFFTPGVRPQSEPEAQDDTRDDVTIEIRFRNRAIRLGDVEKDADRLRRYRALGIEVDLERLRHPREGEPRKHD